MRPVTGRGLTGLARIARNPLIVLIVAGAAYAAFAGPRLAGPSAHDHYARQADAWLQGRLDLPQAPPHRNDWASYKEIGLRDGRTVRGVWRTALRQGEARRFEQLGGATLLIPREAVRGARTRWFVSFPPLPSVLLLPAVALFGPGVNDVVFTCVIAAINVMLMLLLLRRLGAADDLLLTAVFAFGTAHLWCSVLGEVWFTGLIVGVGCGLLFLLAVETDRPLLAGLALAGALATRPHLLLLGMYVPLRGECRPGALLKIAAPVVLTGAALALHNQVRFADPFEFGHTYLAGGAIDRIAEHGLFSVRFLPRNLAAALTLLPTLTADPPYLQISRHGMALWLTTPVLVWALPGGPGRDRRRWALGLAALAVALPPLLYQNTGFVQFGYRFSLDWTAPAVALIALSGRRLGPVFRAAAVWSVAVAVLGAVIFKRFPGFFHDRALL